MLLNTNFVVLNTVVFNIIIHGVNGACVHREKRNRMMRSISNIQRTCDIDAFICQNELDFIIPQDEIFVSSSAMNLMPPPPAVVMGHQPMKEQKTSRRSIVQHVDDPIGEILNDMINFSMEMTTPRNAVVPSFVMEQHQPEMTMITSEFDAMDKIMDDMLSSFFEATSVRNSNPTIFIERINNHGRRLLQEENDPSRERIARRLSSMQYPPTHHAMMSSPASVTLFDRKVDQCLFRRWKDRTLLSNDCAKALQDFNPNPTQQEEYYLSEPSSFVVVLTTLFIFSITTLLLFKILLKSSSSSALSRHNLKRSILHAVYTNPNIKQQVEEQLGEDIGVRSMRRPNHRFSTPLGRFCASLPLMALTILLCYLSVTDPTIVILVGAPVVFALGCFTCCFSDTDEPAPEDQDTVLDDDDVELPPPVPAPLHGDAVFVAVPAVI